MTIVVHQRPLAETRSANNSCRWIGEAIVNRRTYTATSRTAPANDIARQLVADGVLDQPMQIRTAGLKGCMVWESFHEAAARSYRESASTPLKTIAWTDPAAATARLFGRVGPKQGVNEPAATPIAPQRLPPQIEPPATWLSNA